MEIALLLFHKSLSHVLVFFIHLSWFICTHSHGIFPTNHQSFTLCLEQWKKLLMCQNWNYLPYIFFASCKSLGIIKIVILNIDKNFETTNFSSFSSCIWWRLWKHQFFLHSQESIYHNLVLDAYVILIEFSLFFSRT